MGAGGAGAVAGELCGGPAVQFDQVSLGSAAVEPRRRALQPVPQTRYGRAALEVRTYSSGTPPR